MFYSGKMDMKTAGAYYKDVLWINNCYYILKEACIKGSSWKKGGGGIGHPFEDVVPSNVLGDQ